MASDPSEIEGAHRDRGAELHGVEAVRAALRDLEFPKTKGGLEDAAGNWRVPVLVESGRRDIPIARFLRRLPEREYASADAVVDALTGERAERDAAER